jgi:hypothetical protein
MGESKHFTKMQRMDRKLEQSNAEQQSLLNGASQGTEVSPSDGSVNVGAVPERLNSTDAVSVLGMMRGDGPSKDEPQELSHTGWRRTLDSIYEFRWVLLGTAGSWFIFDITFYANGLFSGTILQTLNGTSGQEKHTAADLTKIALDNIFITSIGLPGYICAVLCIDKVGRRNLQLIGFTCVAIVFVFMGSFLEKLETDVKWLFITLYGLTFFFANFGVSTRLLISEASSLSISAVASPLDEGEAMVGIGCCPRGR